MLKLICKVLVGPDCSDNAILTQMNKPTCKEIATSQLPQLLDMSNLWGRGLKQYFIQNRAMFEQNELL